ncbi:MAG TPA: hypothetical protein VF339_16525 [Gammaproteobacteria bacterium]
MRILSDVQRHGQDRPPRIAQGECYVTFAYDVARGIDLEEADRRIAETRRRPSLRRKRRTPTYFEYEPSPLRVSREGTSISIGNFSTRPTLEIMLYDFGAAAAIYTLPLECSLDELLRLSDALYDNEVLLEDSRRQVEWILNVIGSAAVQPQLAPLVEDYVIFHIRRFDEPVELESLHEAYGRELAQILRAELQPLSEEEVREALDARAAYGPDDMTIVDWNAALVVDPEGDDVVAVLEFANVELLEMRFLDRQLDRAMDEAYDQLTRRRPGMRLFGYSSAELERVAELQVDNALVFEGVNNTLKLLGDQYLARIHRLANRRFHIEEWDASIMRKLQTLESIYQKMSDQAASRRLELLEWIIIVLIALSIAISFV